MKLVYLMAVGIYASFITNQSVYADVTPMQTAVGFNLSIPGKSPLMPNRSMAKKETPTKSVGIAMARESVSIVLYPTMMAVHADFEMENLKSDDISMTVGFPLQAALMSGFPMVDFRVLINGVPVQARYEMLTQDIEPGHTVRETWWSFEVTFSKKQKTSITVEYRQPFIGRSQQRLLHQGPSADSSYVIQAGYVFRTGALWDGLIGEAELNVRLVGLEKNEMLVFFDGVNQWPEDGRWIKKNWEPASDWFVEIAVHPRRISAMRESASYDVTGLSSIAKMEDRLIRFSRMISEAGDSEKVDTQFPSLDAWKDIVEVIKSAAKQNSDTTLKSWANRCLAIWRQHLLRSMSLSRDATQLAYALEWLNPDQTPSEEMNEFNRKIKTKPEPGSALQRVPADKHIMFYLTYPDYSNTVFTDSELFLSVVHEKIRGERFLFFGSIFGGMCVIFVVLIVRTIKRRKKTTF